MYTYCSSQRNLSFFFFFHFFDSLGGVNIDGSELHTSQSAVRTSGKINRRSLGDICIWINNGIASENSTEYARPSFSSGLPFPVHSQPCGEQTLRVEWPLRTDYGDDWPLFWRVFLWLANSGAKYGKNLLWSLKLRVRCKKKKEKKTEVSEISRQDDEYQGVNVSLLIKKIPLPDFFFFKRENDSSFFYRHAAFDNAGRLKFNIDHDKKKVSLINQSYDLLRQCLFLRQCLSTTSF